MAWLKTLFGGSAKHAPEPSSVDYKGFRISPMPVREGTKFRIAAQVEADVEGETRSHQLIRADLLDTHEEAVEASIRKARQMIDEQGPRIFS